MGPSTGFVAWVWVVTSLVGSASATAKSAAPNYGRPEYGLRLALTGVPATVRRGQKLPLTFRLHNVGKSVLVLEIRSTCSGHNLFYLALSGRKGSSRQIRLGTSVRCRRDASIYQRIAPGATLVIPVPLPVARLPQGTWTVMGGYVVSVQGLDMLFAPEVRTPPFPLTIR